MPAIADAVGHLVDALTPELLFDRQSSADDATFAHELIGADSRDAMMR
ncbi:MAG TPA: hypothetical protein VFS11_06870 [Gemmatimonadales bacterium]|nr:hypothetical protein [Gemmatimonadales bacterium]